MSVKIWISQDFLVRDSLKATHSCLSVAHIGTRILPNTGVSIPPAAYVHECAPLQVLTDRRNWIAEGFSRGVTRNVLWI